MLIAIDIGNTNINFGIFDGARLVSKLVLPTRHYTLRGLKRRIFGAAIDDALICSVVPKMSKTLARDLRGLLGHAPLVLDKDIIVPIKNAYHDPKQVGQDRLVNAYAGISIFGAPLILVDFGTAITFDIVSAKKEYLGGMILPGLQLSLNALSEHTALLPKVRLAAPAGFIGRDTKNSMRSGIVNGYSCLTESLTAKIKSELGSNVKIIGTGGDIGLIKRYCRAFDKIDADLTLKGLNLIYCGSKSGIINKLKTQSEKHKVKAQIFSAFLE